jgi:hypothetical protein
MSESDTENTRQWWREARGGAPPHHPTKASWSPPSKTVHEASCLSPQRTPRQWWREARGGMPPPHRAIYYCRRWRLGFDTWWLWGHGAAVDSSTTWGHHLNRGWLTARAGGERRHVQIRDGWRQAMWQVVRSHNGATEATLFKITTNVSEIRTIVINFIPIHARKIATLSGSGRSPEQTSRKFGQMEIETVIKARGRTTTIWPQGVQFHSSRMVISQFTSGAKKQQEESISIR